MVVQSESQTGDVGVVELFLVAFRDVAVVVFVAAEDVELLAVAAQLLYLREDIVASLNAHADGILTDHRTLHGRVGGVCLGILDGVDGIDIAHVAIVGLSADNPVPAVQRHIYRADGHRTLHLVVAFAFALDVVGEGVVHRVAKIATQTEAQSGHRIIVDAGCTAKLVGRLELEG